jgi:hypothetical protein
VGAVSFQHDKMKKWAHGESGNLLRPTAQALGIGSGPINLQRSAWKNACNQWLGFCRQGWLPWQESHTFEGVHFSMPFGFVGFRPNLRYMPLK